MPAEPEVDPTKASREVQRAQRLKNLNQDMRQMTMLQELLAVSEMVGVT